MIIIVVIFFWRFFLPFRWSCILVQFFNYMLNFKDHKDFVNLWNRTEKYLTIFQTLQMIEVLHCIVKLVPSSPVTTFMQILSRVFVLWVISPAPDSQSCIGAPLILGSWSLAETTRYLYYSLNIINMLPYFVTWCRYSFFLFLYPTGVTGELTMIYNSLSYFRSNKMFSRDLPNSWNFSIDFPLVLVGVMLSYIPRKLAFC